MRWIHNDYLNLYPFDVFGGQEGEGGEERDGEKEVEEGAWERGGEKEVEEGAEESCEEVRRKLTFFKRQFKAANKRKSMFADELPPEILHLY